MSHRRCTGHTAPRTFFLFCFFLPRKRPKCMHFWSQLSTFQCKKNKNKIKPMDWREGCEVRWGTITSFKIKWKLMSTEYEINLTRTVDKQYVTLPGFPATNIFSSSPTECHIPKVAKFVKNFFFWWLFFLLLLPTCVHSIFHNGSTFSWLLCLKVSKR